MTKQVKVTQADYPVRRFAEISNCGSYRYSLDRRWFEDRPYSTARITSPVPMIFVMLNPSTADGFEDDNTIRRCMTFARRECYKWIIVINLFAGRATKPDDLFKMQDPEGPLNIKEWAALEDWFEYGAAVVCAWGAEPRATTQAQRFVDMMHELGVGLWCLGTTKSGAPRHPLYLKSDTPFIRFKGEA